jgi:hypothetical protein
MLLLIPIAALSACTSPSNQPVNPTISTTTTSAATDPTTAPPAPLLGLAGYGALHLGMTKAEAVGTGLTTATTGAGTGACGGPGDGFLAGAPNPGSRHRSPVLLRTHGEARGHLRLYGGKDTRGHRPRQHL